MSIPHLAAGVDFFSRIVHNYYIMETIKLIPKRLRTRSHRVLFDRDLPFKPKVVKSKKTYKRQEKHRGYELYE